MKICITFYVYHGTYYMRLSHVNNGVVVVGPRVLLAINDSTVHCAPEFYPCQ